MGSGEVGDSCYNLLGMTSCIIAGKMCPGLPLCGYCAAMCCNKSTASKAAASMSPVEA